MTAQNKRPSVKGKKRITSSDVGQSKVDALKADAPQVDVPKVDESVDFALAEDVFDLGERPEKSEKPAAIEEPEKFEESRKPSVGKAGRRSVSQDKARLARWSGLTKRWGKKGIACIAAVVGMVLVAGIFFVWNTYFRYDDAQDIKGEWLVSGGTVVVAIDAQSIRMPGNVSYAYELDDQKKRITFTFSELSGGGEYDFSHGRKVLTVSEGNDGSAGETIFLKISDNAKAKPRVISEKESRKYMTELAPQSLLTAAGMTDSGEAAESDASSDKAGEKKASAKKES